MARLAGLLTIVFLLTAGLPAGGSATSTRASELTIGPIRAVFSEYFRETTYSVPSVVDSNHGATIFYEWTLTLQKVDPNIGIDYGCNNHGKLGGIEKTFVWHHGNADDPKYPAGCDHTKQGKYGHQGLISVIVSDDKGWHCSETYKGTFTSDANSVKNGVAGEPDCSTSPRTPSPSPSEATPTEQLLTQLGQLDGLLDQTIASLKKPGAYGAYSPELDKAWKAVTVSLGAFPGTKLGILDAVLSLNHVDFNLENIAPLAESAKADLERAVNGLDKIGTALSVSPKLAKLGAQFTQLGNKVLGLRDRVKPGVNWDQLRADAKELGKEKHTLIAELPTVFGVSPTELFADVYGVDFGLYRASQYDVDGVRTTAPYIGSYERAKALKQKLETAVKAASKH